MTRSPQLHRELAATLATEAGAGLGVLAAEIEEQLHDALFDFVAHLAVLFVIHGDGVGHFPFFDGRLQVFGARARRSC